LVNKFQAFKAEMMNELKDEFSKMLSQQQKQMMAQFQVPFLGYHSFYLAYQLVGTWGLGKTDSEND
jgi:hypothetical protein